MTLHKAAITTVTVLSPDGRPVVGASVGLVSPGAWLSLKAGGLAQQQHQSAGRLLETDAEGHSGRMVLLQYGSDDLSTLSSALSATTDAQGQFVIPQAPPGRHKLACLVVERLSSTSTSSQKIPLTEVDISPGEATSVTLGASNCTVTVHLRWPDGMKRQTHWRVFS